jgi:tRNA(fMet)-specific endonuclease VapC
MTRVTAASALFVPSIVVGELAFGARNSAHPVQNLQRVEDFIAANSVHACGAETARMYGLVRHALKCKGRPLPENDLWIAAVALEHDLTLVSRDAHFREVDALKLESW